ncbi:MAG: hypothetical protein JNG84_00040 [Archangium sp.]|nr:hypothetical protein [Archangium sp.]
MDEVMRLRVLRLGARALRDDELVQVVAGRSVEVCPRELVTEPLDALLEVATTPSSSESMLRLVCAVELGRRALEGPERRLRLSTPDAVAKYMRPVLAGLRREELHVLCFSVRGVLLRHVKVAEGSVDQCPVDVREVFAPAVTARASAVVLVHNHPSGDATPSVLDVTLTQRLVAAGDVLGVQVLDHLVVGTPGFTSMAQRGLLRLPRGEVALCTGDDA